MGRTIIGIRTVVGGLVGGLVLYAVGFLFWGTPLAALAYSSVDDATSAQLQAALAQGLTRTGTGTYMIPSPGTAQGTVLYGQGPIATVHFNTAGFATTDSGTLISGLLITLITGVLLAVGLTFAGMRTFGERTRLIVLFALAATLYLDITDMVMNHHGAGFYVYTFLSDFIGLSLAGIVIARWFMAEPARAAADPTVTRL